MTENEATKKAKARFYEMMQLIQKKPSQSNIKAYAAWSTKMDQLMTEAKTENLEFYRSPFPCGAYDIGLTSALDKIPKTSIFCDGYDHKRLLPHKRLERDTMLPIHKCPRYAHWLQARADALTAWYGERGITKEEDMEDKNPEGFEYQKFVPYSTT